MTFPSYAAMDSIGYRPYIDFSRASNATIPRESPGHGVDHAGFDQTVSQDVVSLSEVRPVFPTSRCVLTWL